ncbi:unnamed protein product [Polarella glacialis]|uniref:adenosine kinase n=1 Tax=Polarella glacialis TaxID=89957 RepID=A0A813I719_POLGL|nr:unnamed protein product [Polarella glacialis]
MIIGVCQVLLDLVVEVDGDAGIYERYNVEQNTQCLAEERHRPFITDLLARAEAGEVKSSPGGVIANSLRGGAWWLKQQKAQGGKAAPLPSMNMIGMVGRDSAAARLRRELTAAGVTPLFDDPDPPGSREEKADSNNSVAGNDPTSSTGVCCCLLAGKERTMITELGIGRSLHLHGRMAPQFPGWADRIEALKASADVAGLPFAVLVSGFYAQADPDGTAAICSWCSDLQRLSPTSSSGQAVRPILAVTVGANWCTRLPAVQAAARVADFTFANEGEVMELAAALCEASGSPVAVDFDAAMAVIARWKERGWMIGTRGGKSVGCFLAAAEPGKPLSIAVPHMPREEFVDDVGAGDAFMGGFMAATWQRLAVLALSGSSTTDGASNGPDSGKRRREEDTLVDQLEVADIEEKLRMPAAADRLNGKPLLGVGSGPALEAALGEGIYGKVRIANDQDSPWKETRTAGGSVYYYHVVTRQTSWIKPPPEFSVPQPAAVGGRQNRPATTPGAQAQAAIKAAQDTIAAQRGGDDGDRDGSSTSGPIGANLFVYHIPNSWDDSILVQHFEHFGKIISCRVQKDDQGRPRGFGFVSYDAASGAQAAIAGMHGFPVEGKWLKVQLKKGDEQEMAKANQSMGGPSLPGLMDLSSQVMPPPPPPSAPSAPSSIGDRLRQALAGRAPVPPPPAPVGGCFGGKGGGKPGPY